MQETNIKSRRVALEWYQRAVVVAHGHYRAALRYSRLNFWFGIPSIVLATIVGTSVFASLQQKPDFWLQITVGLMSILAAVLSGLQSFLGYNDKAERHRMAGSRYNSIGRELELILAEDKDWTKLETIRTRIDTLAQESPHIPESVHRDMAQNPPEPMWKE